MPLSQINARNEILDRLKVVTDGISVLAANVIFDNSDEQPPDGTNPPPTWARVTVRHVTSGQAALSDQSGKRRYTRRGLVTIQLFVPFSEGGLASADTIASSLQGAFLGVSTPNGVWFRNVRTNEVGVDGPWFQMNVLADFQYDEVR